MSEMNRAKREPTEGDPNNRERSELENGVRTKCKDSPKVKHIIHERSESSEAR